MSAPNTEDTENIGSEVGAIYLWTGLHYNTTDILLFCWARLKKS